MSFYVVLIDRVTPLLEEVKLGLEKASVKANELQQAVLLSCSMNISYLDPLLYLSNAYGEGCLWSSPSHQDILMSSRMSS